jgi:hypothetical protein
MDIIAAVDRKLIKAELEQGLFMRRTNNGNKEIYIFDHRSAPNCVREIGRLREITFRNAGGGTGNEIDTDLYDHADIPFKQLAVWDPEAEEFVGGYRYLEGHEILKTHPIDTPTLHLFDFTEQFKKEYLPTTFELGRSFVQPHYQPNYDLRKGLYSLDNLWDGLGELIVKHPEMEYFFGKITMYPSFNARARDFIHYFLQLYFGEKENTVIPRIPITYKTDLKGIPELFSGKDYLADYKIMNQQVRSLGENIPPLVNAYMNLSATMKYYGTSLNPDFGNVEESGILITIADIYEAKKERHIQNIIRERVNKS